jgi:hypothetical protein
VVIPFADLLIGATALSLGYQVLTVTSSISPVFPSRSSDSSTNTGARPPNKKWTSCGKTLLDISQALKPKPAQPFRVVIRGFESYMCFRQVCATRVVLPSKAIRDSRTISRNAACTSKDRKLLPCGWIPSS